MKNEKYKSLDSVSLINLFKGFIDFYINYKSTFKINISSDKQIKNDSKEQEYIFSIEDPFDKMHNPGDRPKPEKKYEIEYIQQSFQKS